MVDDKSGSSDERATSPDEMLPTESFPIEHHLDRAKAYSNLSASFHHVGNLKKALSAIQEAVTLLRANAIEHPAASQAELAASLRVLSSRLADVGKRKEALAAIEEAVDLYRVLAKEQPVVFKVELASSIIHLSNHLERLSRSEEALSAIQELVVLYHTTAEVHPASSHPALAAALYNLSSRLSKYDLQEDALVAVRGASSLYRDLAAKQPRLYHTKLVTSLNRMAGCLKELGRIEEAVAATQEAVNITQRQGELNIPSEVANAPGKMVAFPSKEAAHVDAIATDLVVTRNEFIGLLDHASVRTTRCDPTETTDSVQGTCTCWDTWRKCQTEHFQHCRNWEQFKLECRW